LARLRPRPTLPSGRILEFRQILKYNDTLPAAQFRRGFNNHCEYQLILPVMVKVPYGEITDIFGHRLGAPGGDKAQSVPGQIFYVTGFKDFHPGKSIQMAQS